ncbi:endonuclease domain-containing protein [Sphingomonas profundi]|uniref:endonuclease domain-containing protein n=1 Tax=Alterirhizorhabdus profundi TaxID=2681549 RepID=UPI002411025E|nr:DUF559 domain-containing protein [Sphingomonas profundi]
MARRLRRAMSLPEVLLWTRLRGGQAGVKFRRQHPVGPYVVDFFCRASGLVVEIDGIAHDMGNKARHDAARDRFMAANGLTVVRIAAADILCDPDAVTAAIAARVAHPLHHAAHGPPPRAGEDLEKAPSC